MDGINEWWKFIVAGAGMAVGYGALRANVKSLQHQIHDHRKMTSTRFLRVEQKVDEAEKVLEGLKVSVENIDKRTDRMDVNIVKLLERK